ncbi:MAG: hypothetical protein AAGJ96_05610 [Pseudomonadota bacterium]
MTKTTHTSLRALATRGALALAISGAATVTAHAGGLDRAGMNVGVIFKEGNYAEISGAFVSPSVSGVDSDGDSTGNIAESYTTFSGALRYEINDKLSISAIVDEPYGADIDYPDGSNFTGTFGDVSSTGIAAIARYKINDSVSVHGGLRYITLDTAARFQGDAFGGLSGYTYSGDGAGTAFLAGGAYEMPEIALRVALTYQTGVDIDLDTTESGPLGSGTSTTTAETPPRILLDFQTGIAEGTLLFGSIQHVAWDGFRVSPNLLFTNGGGRHLVDLKSDAITYRLGLGRRINEQLSLASTVTYEASSGNEVSALAATDGTLQLGVGGTYRVSDMIEVAGGVSYIMPGDATVDTGSGAEFKDNSAIALGGRVGIYF